MLVVLVEHRHFDLVLPFHMVESHSQFVVLELQFLHVKLEETDSTC